MDADIFLARIRARQVGLDVEVPPTPPPQEPASIDRFQTQLLAVGGMVSRVSRNALASKVVEIAQRLEVINFMMWYTTTLDELGVAPALTNAGLSSVHYPTDLKQARVVLDGVRLGIIEAELALAESGTIGFTSDPRRGQLVASLSRVLVAILDPARLLGRLDDVPAWLRARGSLPSALTLMTGPSRTGDVGAKLIIGAHGPAILHVLILEE